MHLFPKANALKPRPGINSNAKVLDEDVLPINPKPRALNPKPSTLTPKALNPKTLNP